MSRRQSKHLASDWGRWLLSALSPCKLQCTQPPHLASPLLSMQTKANAHCCSLSQITCVAQIIHRGLGDMAVSMLVATCLFTHTVAQYGGVHSSATTSSSVSKRDRSAILLRSSLKSSVFFFLLMLPSVFRDIIRDCVCDRSPRTVSALDFGLRGPGLQVVGLALGSGSSALRFGLALGFGLSALRFGLSALGWVT